MECSVLFDIKSGLAHHSWSWDHMPKHLGNRRHSSLAGKSYSTYLLLPQGSNALAPGYIVMDMLWLDMNNYCYYDNLKWPTMFRNRFNIEASYQDCEVVRKVCEAVCTRSARLAAAGVVALAKINKLSGCTVAVSCSLYRQHPKFKERYCNYYWYSNSAPTKSSYIIAIIYNMVVGFKICGLAIYMHIFIMCL